MMTTFFENAFSSFLLQNGKKRRQDIFLGGRRPEVVEEKLERVSSEMRIMIIKRFWI